MDNQKKTPLWLTIVRIGLWVLPFALLLVMYLIKQFSNDYEAVRNIFSVGVLVAMVVGLIIRIFADNVLTPNLNFIGCSLLYGGGIVVFSSSVILGQDKQQNPFRQKPYRKASSPLF